MPVRIPRLARLLANFSVRTRIIVLALIPVAGFLANGLTYLSGESDVGNAFQTVKHSAALADASRDFKSTIAAMRITLKDFTAAPSNDLITRFDLAADRSRDEPRHHRLLGRSAIGANKSSSFGSEWRS